MPHAEVSRRQRARAKTLRRAMTRAETLLWRALKAHHLDGLSFPRQAPIGPYIVDFVCHAARLVFELDGGSHNSEARLRSDQTRDQWLAARGHAVLRFTNDQVLSSLEGVVVSIRETAEMQVPNAPPSPSLPGKGGGSPRKRGDRSEKGHASQSDSTPTLADAEKIEFAGRPNTSLRADLTESIPWHNSHLSEGLILAASPQPQVPSPFAGENHGGRSTTMPAADTGSDPR